MKIGILTFVGTQSHGACLQAYAMKKCLNDLGHEAEIINYIPVGIKKNRDKLIPWKATGVKRKVGALIRYPIVHKRIKKFKQFEQKYLNVYEYVSDIQEIKRYDAIICGSDQVWNPEITANDTAYFLDFIKDGTRKLTYAASLGIPSFPKGIEEKCFSLIEQFEYVNVREKTLKTYLESNITKRSIQVVLDPTQLIEREEWEKLLNPNPLISEPYMLVHYPEMTDETWNKIYKIASERKLKIVFITNKITKNNNVTCLYDVSPIEYLNYIRYADTIITGSFHTLSFSLIFNKNFWCTKALIANRNSRIINLLNYAKLPERTLEHYDKSLIDYKIVNLALQEERKKSLSILKEMCEKK